MFQEVFGNGRLSLLPLHFFVVQALLAQTGEQLFGSDGFDWRRSIAILQTRFPQLFVRHRQGALRVHLIERLDATAQLVLSGFSLFSKGRPSCFTVYSNRRLTADDGV